MRDKSRRKEETKQRRFVNFFSALLQNDLTEKDGYVPISIKQKTTTKISWKEMSLTNESKKNTCAINRHLFHFF